MIFSTEILQLKFHLLSLIPLRQIITLILSQLNFYLYSEWTQNTQYIVHDQ